MDNHSQTHEGVNQEEPTERMELGEPFGSGPRESPHRSARELPEAPDDTAVGAALVRKRFREFMDEPEAWEKKITSKAGEAVAAEFTDEVPAFENSREVDIDEQQPRKRVRRNAIKPNSMTQRVANDVADCHFLEEAAAAAGLNFQRLSNFQIALHDFAYALSLSYPGRVLSAEDVALAGLHDRFNGAAVDAPTGAGEVFEHPL